MTQKDAPKPASKRQRKPAPVSAPALPATKIERIIFLLRREQGADIGELIQATGWQAHSIRGAVSGTLKKRLGLVVISQKSEAGRVYRIAGETAE